MTACDSSQRAGVLKSVIEETRKGESEIAVKLAEKTGQILADLTVGVDTLRAKELQANSLICSVGYQLSGKGFILSNEDATALDFGLSEEVKEIVKPLVSGRDIAQKARQNFAIDLFGIRIEEVRAKFPQIFQWISLRVKPEREQSSVESERTNWWLWSRPRSEFRLATTGLERLIATPLTAKFRYFIFLGSHTICDSNCVMLALEDANFLGVLSSRIHTFGHYVQEAV